MPTEYIPLRVSSEMLGDINKAAAINNTNRSELLRKLIKKGLAYDGYKSDDDRLHKLLTQAVADVTKPQTERLAALSAKNASMAAAAFFLCVTMLDEIYEDEPELVGSLVETAKQLGNEYLKAQGVRLESFAAEAARRMKKAKE